MSANEPGDEQVRLRLKEQAQPRPSGRGLAARRHESWASRWDRGQPEGSGRDALSAGTGWEIVSYLLSGMAVYGGIGWLVGRAVHISILFPVGMVAGLAIALWWVIYRYGRTGGGRERRS